MKKYYWKYLRKSFKHDLSRIITITSIVGLGVGFLVGLLSTTPDLFKTMDTYYDDARLSDVSIRSTIGFTADTDDILKEKVHGIEDVVLSYEEENYVNYGNAPLLARISYRPMNDKQTSDLLTLEEGTWPADSSECVVLKSNKATTDISVGEFVKYKNYAGDEIKGHVVGIVSDPNYVTYQAEQSYMTGSTIKSYIYFDINTFEQDFIYTNANIRFKETRAMDSFSKRYENYINDKKAEITAISDEIISFQKEQIIEEMRTSITAMVTKEAKKQLLEQALELNNNLPIPLDVEIVEQTVNAYMEGETFKNQIKEQVDAILKEKFDGMKASWIVLDRDAIKSAYVFKADALKVQTIAYIFPPFFFLIALLVCMSSISRIITKDRQIIGTFKALGFTKGRIALKYLLYGLISSFIGCALGVGIGLFAIPAALMFVYSTIYYFQTMQFVFSAGIVIGCTLLMMGMITAVVLGVVYTTLKEPAAGLMMGNKAPKPGRKILLEKIPFIWNRLKFKHKSTFRNIFRFKKNLAMMIIGVGGCAGLLLTGFGIKDSFTSISKDQYQDIIKYDAVITTKETGVSPDLIFTDNNIDETHMSVTYLHGTTYGAESINVEIFAGTNAIEGFVGFFDTRGNPLELNQNSVFISEQIAEELGVGPSSTISVSTEDGRKDFPITAIVKNYVSNYIYIGTQIYKDEFGLEFSSANNNAYLLKINGMKTSEVQEHLDTYIGNEYVKAVISTTETRQTYDDIINNLGMIVGLITILSGALAAIVIYNLTDININERIREIATLRVCGYTRREVLMYILREILVMSLIGILVGLGIGVFLHWFIIINISSIGIFFARSIHWSSYLITIAISTAFVVGISFCFYPKIKKVSMTESLKSVD